MYHADNRHCEEEVVIANQVEQSLCIKGLLRLSLAMTRAVRTILLIRRVSSLFTCVTLAASSNSTILLCKQMNQLAA